MTAVEQLIEERDDPEKQIESMEDQLEVNRKALMHGKRELDLLDSELSRLHRATLIEN